MSYEITHHIPAINRAIQGTGWTAKRSRVNPREIIVGMGSNIPMCITIILADNPSDNNRPTWCVGMFRTTTPKELSNMVEAPESPVLRKATSWEGMLEEVHWWIPSLDWKELLKEGYL